MALKDDHYENRDVKSVDGRIRSFETVAASGGDIAPGTDFTTPVRVLEIQGNSADASIVANYLNPETGLEETVTFPACPAGWRSLPAMWVSVEAGSTLQGGTVIGAA